MKLAEDIKPISYIKSHAADMLNQINDTHRPIIVTQNGEARGVFIDTDSYEKMNNTIGYLKLISQSEDDIKNGNVLNSKIVFNKIQEKINERKKHVQS